MYTLYYYSLTPIRSKQRPNSVKPRKIEDGSVDPVDIELKLKAIKASWVIRLVDESCMLDNIFQAYIKTQN